MTAYCFPFFAKRSYRGTCVVTKFLNRHVWVQYTWPNAPVEDKKMERKHMKLVSRASNPASNPPSSSAGATAPVAELGVATAAVANAPDSDAALAEAIFGAFALTEEGEDPERPVSESATGSAMETAGPEEGHNDEAQGCQTCLWVTLRASLGLSFSESLCQRAWSFL